MFKKITALLIVGIMILSFVSCDSGGAAASFNGTYKYNPPTDNYLIKWTYYDSEGDGGEMFDIYARIGGGHTTAIGDIGVYHASDDTQKYYERAWEGEYSYWMVSPGYGYDEWKSDYDEFDPDIGSCDAMEEGFMRYFRAYGFEEREGKLNEYYVGTEKVCGVDCWVFDSKGLNTINAKYWIDPSNGVCLKYMDTRDGSYAVVTEYNLNYTSWTDNLAPSSYEGID